MARKKIECGPPIELSSKYLKNYIEQKCHVCEECGEKTHWPGAENNKGAYPVRVNGKSVSVRRLAFELNGGVLKKNSKIITTCPNHRCINFKLLRQVTMAYIVKEAVKAGTMHTPQSCAKIADTKRRTVGKLSQEAAESIRLDFRPAALVAEENGISESYVRTIRRGAARKSYTANPFWGLMR